MGLEAVVGLGEAVEGLVVGLGEAVVASESHRGLR